jgi:VanZ family protein
LGQQTRKIQFTYYWLPPLLLSAAILFMAGDLGSAAKLRFPVFFLKHLLPSWSIQEITQLYFKLRKIGHFLAYAALFGSYVRALSWHTQMSRLKAIFLALLICLVVSTVDEWRQSFHECRTGCPRDVALDMSGSITAAIAFFPFLRRDNIPD